MILLFTFDIKCNMSKMTAFGACPPVLVGWLEVKVFFFLCLSSSNHQLEFWFFFFFEERRLLLILERSSCLTTVSSCGSISFPLTPVDTVQKCSAETRYRWVLSSGGSCWNVKASVSVSLSWGGLVQSWLHLQTCTSPGSGPRCDGARH